MSWAIKEKDYTQRRACALIGLAPKVYRHRSQRLDDGALRARLKGLAAGRRRFGYRRLHLLLKREGVSVNHKKLFRIYQEERLIVKKRGGRKRALGTRAPMAIALGANQRWSLDFVSDALSDGRRFRVLAIVDDFTRECLTLLADTSLSGTRVARELRCRYRNTWQACADRQRQRHRTHLDGDPALAAGDRRRLALHPARQADAERLRRELQWAIARRVP